MIWEILIRTPIWVFALFFGLLALGYMQSRPRIVNAKRMFILPVSMIGLSIYGVYSAFSLEMTVLVGWIAGALVSVGLGFYLFSDHHTEYDTEKQSFSVPGSWTPMCLIMIIFFIKYFVGYAQAVQLPVIENQTVIVAIAFLYGCLSGIFAARTLRTMKSMNRSKKQKRAAVSK